MRIRDYVYRLLSITTVWMILDGLLLAQPTAEIIPLHGEPLPAQLVGIRGDLVEFIDGRGLHQSLEFSRLIRWGSLAPAKLGDQILLADGSLMVGRVLEISKDTLRVSTTAWGELAIPREVVQGVIWTIPSGQLWRLRDQLRRRVDVVDQLRLSNGDQWQGTLIQADDRQLTFRSAAGEVSLPLDRLQCWRSAQSEPLSPFDPSVAIVGLGDGSQLAAQSVTLDRALRIELACGLRLVTQPDIRRVAESLLTYLRPSNPQVAYLSDLESLGHKHIPLLSLEWSWQRDRNVLGGPLSWGGSRYDKGIGMHSTSRLAFDLSEPFVEFQAEIAIDGTAGPRGSVVFRIYTSGDDGAWSQVYASQIIRGTTKPVPLRVDIRQAKRLALVVDYADGGDVLDRANWIGARLVRELRVGKS